MSSGSERRVHPRYTAPYRVVVSPEEGAKLATMTDNLSGGGLFLAHAHDLPTDQQLELSIHLPDGHRAVRCKGKVVRRISRGPDGRGGFGVQLDFEQPAEAISYLQRLNALRAGEVDTAPVRYPVLVVEDNEVLSEIVASSLPLFWKRRYAYGPFLDVDVAPSGDVALEMMRAREYHLVISDIFMPKLDGRGFIKAIRDDAKLAPTPVLAISAADVADEVMRLDADGFMRKPLRLRELFDMVHLLISGYQALEDDPAEEFEENISPLEQALRNASD